MIQHIASERSGAPRSGIPVLPPAVSSLRAAASHVVDNWGAGLPEELAREEVAAELERTVRSLERSAEGAAPESPLPAALRKRLLELLRAALVREWSRLSSPPDPTEMLPLLNDLERLGERLQPNWEQYFSSRLRSPDGAELVTEFAHDLRSPLTSILFLAETLHSGQSGEVNDLQRRQLGILYSAALGMISTASDMIEFTRGSDDLAESRVVSFSVAEVLDSVCDIIAFMADEKGVTLRARGPSPDQRVGTPVALSRVLLNLATNALRYTEQGFVEILGRETGPRSVEFSVRDTGSGMDASSLEQLYQPYHRRPDRAGYFFSGSGLGLMICRRLVRAMGSELRVESKAHWGTRFSFEVEIPPVDTPPRSL